MNSVCASAVQKTPSTTSSCASRTENVGSASRPSQANGSSTSAANRFCQNAIADGVCVAENAAAAHGEQREREPGSQPPGKPLHGPILEAERRARARRDPRRPAAPCSISARVRAPAEQQPLEHQHEQRKRRVAEQADRDARHADRLEERHPVHGEHDAVVRETGLGAEPPALDGDDECQHRRSDRRAPQHDRDRAAAPATSRTARRSRTGRPRGAAPRGGGEHGRIGVIAAKRDLQCLVAKTLSPRLRGTTGRPRAILPSHRLESTLRRDPGETRQERQGPRCPRPRARRKCLPRSAARPATA